ncbi:monovalent cation/H+ antiporter complex subunit F [Pyrococcus abyssi]|uniref:Multiple resistance and pH regulation protein F n=1 Tax=Pyrococcus abyssi (strain GE5 / Orsay) TaxID=272844 RepID=Q8J2W2_PYRAB|nr:monovalent cation/H+ antiporter complex subunit F [Pyrococcus abyssi]CAD55689.1 Na+/H+ antiporter MnhF subunit, putative [Pyrococcus abyssi GE5]CCE70921.1 TPA: multiple resistance and pH regulation protein F [Pyrococcus abyssi GE5]
MELESSFLLLMKFVIPIYLLAIVIYVIRAIKGPTIVDIILAVDCLSFDIAAFMALLAIYFKSVYLVSGAIILALWGYLLDIYVAKYLVSGEVGA